MLTFFYAYTYTSILYLYTRIVDRLFLRRLLRVVPTRALLMDTGGKIRIVYYDTV